MARKPTNRATWKCDKCQWVEEGGDYRFPWCHHVHIREEGRPIHRMMVCPKKKVKKATIA